ncbi:MAG TPA: twin-arginine translocase TatA/TatE family subunit [Ktedonobacterales bacterium]|nr:twin-arginine translocase TatA/TatE family subunit [Ktedonobacterales bacterium]
MFGHWFEILLLLGLALLVFGPKRLIEMGSQLGKSFRELQSAMKDVNWSSLMSEDETPSSPSSNRPNQSVASRLSQFSQNLSETANPRPPTSVSSAPIVDSTVEHTETVEDDAERDSDTV